MDTRKLSAPWPGHLDFHTRRRPVFRMLPLIALALLTAACSSNSAVFNSDPSLKACRNILRTPTSHPSVARASLDDCRPQPGEVINRRAPIRNLVFEGGGVKGTAYVGVLELLHEQGLLAGVERVAGTSAGAITALLLGLGYDVDEIRRIVLEDLDFARLEDGNGIYRNSRRLVSRYGWYRGDYFLCFIERLIAERLGAPDATFADLAERARQDADYRPLWVVGTDVRSGSSRVFSAETHPQLPLADAIRISMSIPFFFAARELTEGDATGLFVDGAVLRSYPISVFDEDGKINMETLGFHLGTNPVEQRPVDNIVQFTGQIFKSLIDVQLDALCRTPADVARTVFIDGSATETTNFAINTTQQCQLIHTGAEATAEYLSRQNIDIQCPEQIMEYLQQLGLR